MPEVSADGITVNYEQQGSGEPLVLIPYLSADHACYAFQVAEYAKHFTCYSLDLPGTGESDKPAGIFTTERFADIVAAFLDALDIPPAHIFGLSLGGAVGMWLAAKHPGRVKSLSLHSTWPKSDPFLVAVVEQWQVVAKALDSVPETTVRAIFPWCFTPELYAARPDYIASLAAFVRSRPPQPVEAFLQHSSAVIAHDVEAQLGRITAPTQITFGRHDLACSTRFADRMTSAIRSSELVIFEDCSHGSIYENVEAFNRATLDFLQRHATRAAGANS